MVQEQHLDDGMISEFVISHTYWHDTGLLSCHASNAYGQDEMVIQFIVQGTELHTSLHPTKCII
jgi:hypothetical protein